MAELITREVGASAKGSPLTNAELDQNFINLNTDSRLSNSREWTASTVSQAEAEAGTSTVRRAWTAQRVRQAISAAVGVIDNATQTVRGLMSPEDKTKLDGIAAGATKNATDAQLRDRSTHTGTQPISTVTGLQTALDGKSATGHTHDVASIVGLSDAATTSVASIRSGTTKADVGLGSVLNVPSYSKTEADGLLAGKLNSTATAVAANKLATARTVTLAGDASGAVSFDGSANVTLTVTVKDDSHNHVIGNVDGLQSALDARAVTSSTVSGGPSLDTYVENGVYGVWPTASPGKLAGTLIVTVSGQYINQTLAVQDEMHIRRSFDSGESWSPWTAVSMLGHTHDDRYYTEAEADSRFVNVTDDESISGVKTFSTALAVTGTGKAAGRFYAGTTDPTNATRTNYDGDLHARAFGTGRFKIEYNADSESLDFNFV